MTALAPAVLVHARLRALAPVVGAALSLGPAAAASGANGGLVPCE